MTSLNPWDCERERERYCPFDGQKSDFCRRNSLRPASVGCGAERQNLLGWSWKFVSVVLEVGDRSGPFTHDPLMTGWKRRRLRPLGSREFPSTGIYSGTAVVQLWALKQAPAAFSQLLHRLDRNIDVLPACPPSINVPECCLWPEKGGGGGAPGQWRGWG